VALVTFRRRRISGTTRNQCAACRFRWKETLVLAGKGVERGSSGEHAMKIIERDVAGASCGERFIKRTRSGGDAQPQRPEEGGQKVYPLRGLEAGRARTMGKIAARSIMVLQ
jgi:hypothetical protein